ncbi:capsular biosynthesis protein [Neorhizobium lilium]|uniref:Capsular biosynthesis protein n=2 Tax=Neorhizobium lilium TaxID=2503024 RepID=A0A444LK51_9HYPH|nr:capsular biosynthesis protein [Neorhizobium lilium]
MSLGATFYVRQSQPWLKYYLGVEKLQTTMSPGIGGIVRWGGRIPAKTASLIARIRRLPVWYLEDGFLRSVGLGKSMTLPISIQIDDLGMPIDASRPSRLEQLIAGPQDDATRALGDSIREVIVRRKLSKYNNLPHRAPEFERTTRRRLLLVDQVFGDVSVPLARGSGASFERMLEDAVASGAQCIVRTHPDVMAGFRKGYLAEQVAGKAGVILSADPVSVSSVLDAVDEVWTVSSQFGLDAMMRGLPVRCYGAPFYAGWGLTDDHFSDEAKGVLGRRRTSRPTIEQLVAAAFAFYPVYRDTQSWEEIDVFRAMDLLVAERRQLQLD